MSDQAAGDAEFAAAARVQSVAVARSEREAEDQAFVTALSTGLFPHEDEGGAS